MTLLDATNRFDQQQNSRAIDALRGYAILLVICVHVFGHVPTLIWPVKRLLVLGHTGVQLFFIASAVTLLMSWNRESGQSLPVRVTQFLNNRLFRIAPLYVLAIIFYWFFENRTLNDFTMERLVATLLFYNAWSPYLLPTVGGWMPAPGGWSISVEFMFYLLFPLLAMTVTTVRRAVLFLLLSYAVMLTASIYGLRLYPEISNDARTHFLFFWPPNQLVIFAVGFLLYQAIKSPTVQRWVRESHFNANSATVILGATLLVVQFYAKENWPVLTVLLPQHLLMALLFAVWALFMIVKPAALAAPTLIVNIGRMSFSIYLLHFAAIVLMSGLLTRIWPFPVSGAASVIYVSVLLAISTLASYQIARLTYQFVEKPMIRYGKSRHGRGLPLSAQPAASVSRSAG